MPLYILRFQDLSDVADPFADGALFYWNNTTGAVTDSGLKIVSGNLAMGSGVAIDWNSGDVTLTHSANKLEVAGGIFIIPDGALVAPSLAFSGNNGLGLSRTAGGRLALAGGNIQLGSSDTTFVSTQLSWDSDGAGNIGALTTSRPDAVYVKTSVGIGGVIQFSATAPTLSGFGTNPSVSGTSVSFTIDVGTGGTASTGTITFPAAPGGWKVDCVDVTNNASYVTSQTGGGSTTATLQNYSRTTGLAIAWTASDILRCAAVAY